MSLVPSHDAANGLSRDEGPNRDLQYHLLPAPIGGDFYHDTPDLNLQPLIF